MADTAPRQGIEPPGQRIEPPGGRIEPPGGRIELLGQRMETPGGRVEIDAEELAGRSFPYQHDISLVEDIDLMAATPGPDLNWLEDVELLSEDGVPAVFDRYSNSFLKIHFPIPPGREDEIARKVLIAHLQSGNSYGVQLKRRHAKFPQPLLGSWVEGSETVGGHWQPPELEGWEAPTGH
jgi:hypothetical protein